MRIGRFRQRIAATERNVLVRLREIAGRLPPHDAVFAHFERIRERKPSAVNADERVRPPNFLRRLIILNLVLQDAIGAKSVEAVDRRDSFRFPPDLRSKRQEKIVDKIARAVKTVKTVKTVRSERRRVSAPRRFGVPKIVEPIAIVEIDAIRAILDADQPVIAAGGGGIPVIKQGGMLVGASAMIDKDLTAAVLAKEVDADVLMYLTDVDNIVLNYGSDSEIPLYELSAAEAESLVKIGQFAAGAMDPKIRGGIDFIYTGKNRKVIITTVEKARAALDGKAGTVIY